MFLFLSFQNNQYIDIYLVLDFLFCSKLFMVWHSRAVGEQLTYSARMPDQYIWSGIRTP